MPKTLERASDMVAVFEGGELNVDLSTEIRTVLEKLQDLAPANGKGKVKGSITLKMSFAVSGKTVEVETDISSKTPKRPRSTDVYFVTPDAKLSTDHPQQERLFEGPREVRHAG